MGDDLPDGLWLCAFEKVLADAFTVVPMRLVGYVVMFKHLHVVVWPRTAGDPSKRIQPDPFSRPEYRYDAFGNRLERRVGDGTSITATERFAYDGWDTARPQALANEGFDAFLDLDDSNDVTMRRVFGSGFDEILARQAANGDVAWYATDRLSSVRAVFDKSASCSLRSISPTATKSSAAASSIRMDR